MKPVPFQPLTLGLGATLVATLVVTLVATAALAQTTASQTVSPQAVSPLIAAITAIEAKGYRVDDIDTEGSWLDVDAINTQGQRVELIVDAATGGILREQLDD